MELAAFVVAEWRRDARLDAVRVANTAREGAYAACEANIARRVACGCVRSATTSQEGGFHFQVLGHRRAVFGTFERARRRRDGGGTRAEYCGGKLMYT